jgi:hypothetical protein
MFSPNTASFIKSLRCEQFSTRIEHRFLRNQLNSPLDYAIEECIFDLPLMSTESPTSPPLEPGINFTLSKIE